MISEPGIYDLPMSVYHSQCCVAPSVSSGGLRTVYLQSPADFWAFSDLNDNRIESPASPSLFFGRAAHALLLGDEDFEGNFAVVPSDAPRAPTQAQINARDEGRVSDTARRSFEFWDSFNIEHEGKDFITESELGIIRDMSFALSENPIMSLLFEGEAEKSFIWRDDKTGLYLKSRLDMLCATGDLADLKTTSVRSPDRLSAEIRSHGYDMQFALATVGLEELKGIPFEADYYQGRACIVVFICKKPPYHIMPVEIDFDALYWARLKCRAAIDTIAQCINDDYWPGPVQGIRPYSDGGESERLAELQRVGLLPSFY